MTELMRSGKGGATLRVLAALVGTLPVATLASACLARLLPLEEPARFTVGFTLAIPAWVAAMCVVFLARSAQRAWGVCAGAALLLGALAYGVPQ